jgi:branched-chain amino acid transport system permease protein
MSLVLLPNILVNTLVLASMYILASLGFAFIFNMLGAMNLAHGTLYMISAYVCYYLCAKLGMSNWLAMLCSALALVALGLALERFCFRPFYDDFNRIIMISVALMTIMQTSSVLISGSKNQKIPSFAEGTSELGFLTISNEKIVTFSIGLFLLLVTLYVVNRTKLGMQMEAVAQDRVGAALQGIDINRVSSIVFAFGCALAAVSGCLMGAYQQITPFMGDGMQTRILMLVMLAGAGSMNGIIITGTIMALVDSFFPVVLQSYAAGAASVSLIIVLLLIRPKGFFGHEM